MRITIGSNHSNPIVIEASSISRTHAELEIRENGIFVLQDLESKNGVRVNDRRIRKTRITDRDTILLGDHRIDNNSFFKKIQEHYNTIRVDFTDEYTQVLQTLQEYDRQKERVLRSPLLPTLIKLGIGAAVIAVLLLFPKAIPNDSVRIGLIMSVGILSALTSTVLNRTSNKKEKLDKLKLQYEDDLVCPKCKASLINHGITYLSGRSRCVNQKCDAVYKVN